MHDEFTARQRAITLRLSGRSVQSIGSALGRSEFRVHESWRRSLESGAEGRYDLTRADHQVVVGLADQAARVGHLLHPAGVPAL